MSPHTSYPNPPIVEAIVAFRFGEEMSGSALADFLSEPLRAAYPDRRAVPADAEGDASEDASNSDNESTGSFRSHSEVTLLRSADGLRAIGCRRGHVSVHVLEPYPGWAVLLDMVNELVQVMPEAIRSEPLSSVSIRYIDRITLPPGARSLNDYITAVPVRPPALPALMTRFHFMFETHDPGDGTMSIMTIATAPSTDSGGPVVILDLNLQRGGDSLSASLADDGWRSALELLHVRQREVFEGSITDDTRRLFQ